MAYKHPKAKREPQVSKTPKKAGFDENPLKLRPAWRIGAMEMCDPFGWHALDAGQLLEIRDKLKSFESMTWGAIIGPQSHGVSTESLCKDARDRLAALRLDELEELFSLRLSGKERIWGVLEHNVLILLWWDPDHQVCPSLKKNT
jgi:hypothetical protein